MDFANNAIQKSYSSQIIFIDEVGRLERERKCMYEQISRLIDETKKMNDKIIIMIVRESLLQEILELLNIKPMKIWTLQEKSEEKKVIEIYNYILQIITK
jgi:nucleoside-triphosphatase THEP1